MNPFKFTAWITPLWIIMAIAYDYLAFRLWGGSATISQVLRVWGDTYPVLLIALGCLLWHLFGKGQ